MKRFTLSRFSRIEGLPQPPDVPEPSVGRYQPVLGTVAYDDINKRMNVTTMTGTNGKASGRLKSYKFREGAQQFDVTLPVGDSGDFICMVTHATDARMTNGIGVGLRSDGAGNWNIATLSGTKVTVGASSGLTDGKTARIEIEKDNTGAYWYYIYDAAGTKPTTATGKLFTALSEGYTGWYANGNSKTYAIDNISIRAESIVGRTNVEVTEPFWFRDEFSDPNSIRRYTIIGVGTDAISDGVLHTPHYSTRVIYPYELTGSSEIFVDIGNASGGEWAGVNLFATDYLTLTAGRVTSGYRLEAINRTTIRLLKNGTQIESKGGFDFTSVTRIGIRYDADTHTVYGYVGGAVEFTYVDPDPCVRGYALLNTGNVSGSVYYDNLQISGTRIYNKPIHRGAMLETYHDGTQEVVGTTFIDDCQWDRSAEYKYAVYNAAIGGLRGTASLQGFYPPVGLVSDIHCVMDLYSDSLTNQYIITGTRRKNDNSPTDTAQIVDIRYRHVDTNHYLSLRILPTGTGSQVSFDETFVTNRMRLEWSIIGNTVYAKLTNERGEQRSTSTSGVINAGYPVISYFNSNVYVTYLQIIAAESSSTNGIAACIPPIGGGARYGVEESVYNTFTTENINKGVYLTTARVKTTNPNADEVSLEYTKDTTSITLNTTPIDVNATYTVKTAPITIDANETDTLRVSVKNSTTCVQSTNYVDSLSLIPISGDDVLYPQDLAFISGVKPSQKRKVEVK